MSNISLNQSKARILTHSQSSAISPISYRKKKFVVRDQAFFIVGDSNEAKIKVAEYSTILFQQGQPRFVLDLKQLSNVFKSNRTGIEPESNTN